MRNVKLVRGCLGVVAIALSTAVLAQQDPSSVPVQVYESIEKAFSVATTKADSELEKAKELRDKAVSTAAAARLQQYQEKLKEVTKTGDFDKAIGIKARIQQLENDPEAAAETKRPNRKSELKILSASYGVNQSWFDVTDKVEHLLSKKDVIVSDTVFGDPAPEYQPGNTLVVRYERKGVSKLVALYTGKPFILP